MAEQQNKAQEQDINQLRKVRRENWQTFRQMEKNPYVITKYDVTAHAQEVKDRYAELEGKMVSVAGRVMQKRVMGKASFCNILDQSGNIQSYVRKRQHWRRSLQGLQEAGYRRYRGNRRRGIYHQNR